jgi:bifunctional oligoribonuclease and PAP phosphatase NrnA
MLSEFVLLSKFIHMLTKIISEDLVQQAKHLLKRADTVAILSHQGPDGDAVGSSLAMAEFLLTQGKHVQVIFPDPFPDFLRWMPGSEKSLFYSLQPKACELFLTKSDVIICLDFNHLKRMGRLGEVVANSPAKRIMLDHHPEPDEFAEVQMSYPSIASTSELVFRYICRSGSFDEMTKKCAECIYTGMMTDTGAFSYNSNKTEMYYIVSELINKGVDKDAIYSRVYNTWSADRMRLMGFVLHQRMKVYPEFNTAILHLSLEDLKKYNYQIGDTEGFVNLPLSISGIVFSVFVREEAGRIKLSFRSQGTFPVNKVAAELFNGGGHLNAAGGEFEGTLEEALCKLEEALPTFGVQNHTDTNNVKISI